MANEAANDTTGCAIRAIRVSRVSRVNRMNRTDRTPCATLAPRAAATGCATTSFASSPVCR